MAKIKKVKPASNVSEALLWVLGTIVFLFSLLTLMTGLIGINIIVTLNQAILFTLFGLFMLVSSLLIIPFTYARLENLLPFKLSYKDRLLIVLLVVIAYVLFSGFIIEVDQIGIIVD